MDVLRADLEKVLQVSDYLDFPFSLEEISTYFLPRHNTTAERLRSLINHGLLVGLRFEIQDGHLLTRPSQWRRLREEREHFSSEKLKSAARFAKLLTRLVPFVRTIAVTGSVAYGSASKWDDIDLFIVTQRKRLWLTILMALTLARVNKILGLRASHLLPFCLSYVHDERGFATDARRNHINPLFARELLKAVPVAGSTEYRKLLENNRWVADLYADPYRARLEQLERDAVIDVNREHLESAHPLVLLDWAEGVVFVILSSYLRVRAYLTNLRLRSRHDDLRVFEPMITENSCVYTSNFYKWLHSLWGK